MSLPTTLLCLSASPPLLAADGFPITAAVLPEPLAGVLSGLGFLLLLRRRRFVRTTGTRVSS